MKKKDKLYTVTPWNKRMVVSRTGSDREENLFWDGGTWGSLATKGLDLSQHSDAELDNLTNLYKQEKGGLFNLSKQANPFSKGNIASANQALKSNPAAGAALSAAAGLVGGLANKGISGGLESGAGSTISGLGSAAGGIVGQFNPLAGAAVTVGSNILGGLTNRAFGTKTNEAALRAANEGTAALNNFRSNAGSFDEIQGPQAVAGVQDAYKGGWFSGRKARRKNAELRRQRMIAQDWANRSVDNNIDNLVGDQMSEALANYSAFGGPLEMIGNMDGAIGYGFMSDYLTMKNRQNEVKDKMSGISYLGGEPQGTNALYALGGDLQSHGADWSDGMMKIENGGSHESNVNGGVRMGVDGQGVPNLVEENETVYNDFVYSARIPVSDEVKKRFHLPRKKEMTYAEVSKKLEKEASERPNDPISQAAFKKQMGVLAEMQEEQKKRMEEERARKAFEALSPEEKVAVLQQHAEQKAIEEEMMKQEMAGQNEVAEGEPQGTNPMGEMMNSGMNELSGQDVAVQNGEMACGGKMYANGGSKAYKIYNGKRVPAKASSATMASYIKLLERSGFSTEEINEVTRPIREYNLTKAGKKRLKKEAASATVEQQRKQVVPAAVQKEVSASTDNDKAFESWWAQATSNPNGSIDFGKIYKSIVGVDGPTNSGDVKNALRRLYDYRPEVFRPYDVRRYSFKESNFAAAKKSEQQNRVVPVAKQEVAPAQAETEKETKTPVDVNSTVKQEPVKETVTPAPVVTPAKRTPAPVARKSTPASHALRPGSWSDNNADHWNTFTRPGLEAFIEDAEEKINNAKTEEEKDAIRRDVAQQFNAIQQGYVNIYPDEISDTYAFSQPVKDHQIRFNDAKGNTGFASTDAQGNVSNLVADAINIPNGAASADRPDQGWADGYWGPRTSIRNFGSTEYGDNNYYSDLADRFGKMGLTYAPNSSWNYKNNGNDYQLYGLSIPEVRSVEAEDAPVAVTASGNEDVLDRYKQPWTPEAAAQGEVPAIAEESRSFRDPAFLPKYEDTGEEDVKAPIVKGEIVPKHKYEGLRYAGLFGPAVGLGMQMAGVGKPDYSRLDAAVASANQPVHLANWKPIGNYLTYKPMDIWAEQNRLAANARATDRAIMNTAGTAGSKMAGLLASGYNSQIADGELYRKALEYNDAQREKVEAFNRGTNQYNSQAYQQNSQFNADAKNRARQYGASMALNAAAQRMNADAGWYNSLYGNISGLMKGIGDLGRENKEYNMMVDLLASGAIPGVTPEKLEKAGLGRVKKVIAKGGKISKRKGKRGLTF